MIAASKDNQYSDGCDGTVVIVAASSSGEPDVDELLLEYANACADDSFDYILWTRYGWEGLEDQRAHPPTRHRLFGSARKIERSDITRLPRPDG